MTVKAGIPGDAIIANFAFLNNAVSAIRRQFALGCTSTIRSVIDAIVTGFTFLYDAVTTTLSPSTVRFAMPIGTIAANRKLSFIIQKTLTSRFEKYSKIPSGSNMTGAQVAERMLLDHNIHDVKVTCIKGTLTDHYNPQTKTVNLSEGVYYGSSVAAAAVAAHECGHVVQHATGYAPLKMRTALVPVVQFSSNIVQWVLLAGVLMVESFPQLLWFGIGLFALTTLFSFITLPVEINASRRAVNWLGDSNLVSYETRPMAVDSLKWAAYTYVIAAIGSLATLVYYILLAQRRN